MKRAFADWFRTSRALAFAALLAMLAACGDETGVMHYTQSMATVQSPGVAAGAAPPAHSPVLHEQSFAPAALPFVVARPLAARPSDLPSLKSDSVTYWHRFRFDGRDRQEALSIYIPRWHAFAGQLDFYINGDHVAAVQDVWNRPLLIPIPKSTVARSADQGIEVLLAASLHQQTGGALSTVWIGPTNTLQARHSWRQFLQVTFPQVASICFLICGAFAFAFWMRRRNESAYLLFAAMAAVNFVRTLHYHVLDPIASSTWFWWLTINSLAWLMVLANLFALRMHRQRFVRSERTLIGLAIAVSAISAAVTAFGSATGSAAPAIYLLLIVAGVLAAGLATAGAIRNPSHAGLSVAVALWVNLCMGVHDWFLQSWKIDVESIYLMPYGSMYMMAVFLYAVLQRFLATINQVEELNATLENRLAERGQELQASYEKLNKIEREQAIGNERQRLMREMHDGLGSSLMSSLAMVEQGELDHRAVAQVLRESIDDLKLTIDSLEPIGNDLPTLLGTLRYRLGKRLELAGLELDWRVRETPPLAWLNPTTALQILRVLQEALTNVLKHADATQIRVETTYDERTVQVVLTDNGKGFDLDTAQSRHGGRGLRNMQRRAASMNSSVVIASKPGATSVALILPIDA